MLASFLREMINLGVVDLVVMDLSRKINDLYILPLIGRPNGGGHSCVCVLGR